MRRFLTTAALALATYGVATAAPTKVAFANLFRAKASWRLPCRESHGDGRVTKSHPLGDLVCTIDGASRDGAAKRAHLHCTGLGELDGTDLGEAFAPRTLVGTSEGLWTIADPTEVSLVPKLAEVVRTPPLFAAHPEEGVRRENHGDQDACCTGSASDPCTPCPPAYRGVEYTTAQLATSWCVRSRPWGTGGAPSTTVFCVSGNGALTGVAAYKNESDVAELRCGSTIDPQP